MLFLWHIVSANAEFMLLVTIKNPTKRYAITKNVERMNEKCTVSKNKIKII